MSYKVAGENSQRTTTMEAISNVNVNAWEAITSLGHIPADGLTIRQAGQVGQAIRSIQQAHDRLGRLLGRISESE